MAIDLTGYKPADDFYTHGFDRRCAIVRDWISTPTEIALNVPCTIARHRITLQTGEGDIIIPSLNTMTVFIACKYQRLDEDGNLLQVVFTDQEKDEVKEEDWVAGKKRKIVTVHVMVGDILFVEGVWHALRIRQIINPLLWKWHLELTCVPDMAKHGDVPHIGGGTADTSTLPPLIPFP